MTTYTVSLATDDTFEGGDAARLFFVGGAATGTDVTIANLTLANGTARGANGGTGDLSGGGDGGAWSAQQSS